MKFSFSRSKVSLSIYILFLISYMIQTSNLYNQYGHFAKGLIVSIYVLAYILATLLLSTQKYTFKSITWICFLLVVGICVFKVNYQSDVIESLTVFNMMIMIISSKNIDIDEYIRKDIIVRTSTTIILFLLSISGIITNIVTSRSNGVIRAAWGYGHANRFGSAIFLMILYYTYIHRKELTKKLIFIQVISCVVVYVLSNSRTATLGILSIILFTLIVKMYPAIKRRKKVLTNIFLATLGIVSLFLIYGIIHFDPNSEIYKDINTLFNSRLELATLYNDYYNITPFGAGSRVYTWNEVQTLGLSRALTSIDILYIKILYNYGIITFNYIFIYINLHHTLF